MSLGRAEVEEEEEMDNNGQTKDMIGKWPYPIDFLENYKNFALKIRPISIKAITDLYDKTKNTDEKRLLFFSAYEQYFFAIETLSAFFSTAVDESPLDLAKWIYPKPVGKKFYYHFSNLAKSISEKSKEDIFEVYRNEFSDVEEDELGILIKPLVEILLYLKETPEKQQQLVENIDEAMREVFNRSKHKFLAYRLNDGVAFLTSEKCDRKFNVLSQKLKMKGKNGNTVPIHLWFTDSIQTVVEYTAIAIDKIMLRLSKPGANKWISGPGSNFEHFSLH